ncbi:hypothetical protein [Carboxylicivirga taeanensis]|uniref:hypothetical protein n=1 Tax=Carboxylicivirga taeanensis TaxID=1416875 RepID=UPI003F6DB8FB
MRKLTILLLLSIGLSIHGQTCKDSLRNYLATIDTTERKVVFIAEEMPDIFSSSEFFMKKNKEIRLDELSCCPIYVWFAFVVETSGTLSNIVVCPQFIACDSLSIESNSKILKAQFIRLFENIHTNPGKIDGKPVAIAHTSRVHYECMDWKN